MNLKEIGDNLFSEELEYIVEKSPYLSFVLLSAILEFMGNCYRKGHGSKDETRLIFYDLINNNDALKAYKQLNFTDKKDNYLYKYLRCGMLHEVLPKKEIILGPDKNDLSKCVIGAKELYEDMKKAWDELKLSPEVSKYMECTDALTVFDEFSGSTASSLAVVMDTYQTNDSENNTDEDLIAITEA